MTLDELIPLVARFFEKHEVAYFTFGGVAVSVWGEPRTTKDLDVVVHLDKKEVPRLCDGLRALGFKMTKSIQRKLREGKIVQLPIGKTRLDLKLSRSALDREAFERSETAKAEGFELRVSSPEDLILYKLQAWRLQDQADVENLLRNVKHLDRTYIEKRLGRQEKESGLPIKARWKSMKA